MFRWLKNLWFRLKFQRAGVYTSFDPAIEDGDWGSFDDRLYECGNGTRKGIGISVGGTVHVRPLKEWHALIDERDSLKAELGRYKEALEKIVEHGRPLEAPRAIYKICDINDIAIKALRGDGIK